MHACDRHAELPGSIRRGAVLLGTAVLATSVACASAPRGADRTEHRVVLDGVTVEDARAAAREAIAVALPEATIGTRDGALVARSFGGYETRLDVRFARLDGSTAVVVAAHHLVERCERAVERPVVYRECNSGAYPYTATPCRVDQGARSIEDRERDCRTERRASDGSLEKRILASLRAALETDGGPRARGALPTVEPPTDWP